MRPELLKESQIPSADVDVYESGSRPRRADYTCKIGRDLTIDPERLGHYCLTDVEPVVDDLVLIAGAIAFTDRVVARRPSIAWRRNLHVSIPVHEPARWQDAALYRQLICALDYVTGDNWELSFKLRRNKTPIKQQALLPIPNGAAMVMPFSDGLDSFAVSRLITAQHPNVPLFLVTTGKHKNRAVDESNAGLGTMMSRVAIPFNLSSKHRKVRFCEASYRSRAFVFGVIAGVAAHHVGANSIYVAESGQGSLGPWLTPVGNEAPDVRMHPSFTARLSSLLNLIFGSTLSHIHSQLWQTKGETLKALTERGLSDGWWLTSSCARDQRYVFLNNKRIQCGVCAGCLLRRESLFAANLSSELDRYLWDDLQAPSLGQAVQERITTPNDERQALCAVHEMQGFGNMVSEVGRIRTASEDLSPFVNQDSNTVEANLIRLIAAHASEWQMFRSMLGSQSFINQWLDVLQ
jgi:7-cyano-7-deazaguanine synthase in queuosine biosynthesis